MLLGLGLFKMTAISRCFFRNALQNVSLFFDYSDFLFTDEVPKKPSPPPGVPSRQGSRLAVLPMAKATGVSFLDDLAPQMNTSRISGRASVISKSSPSPLMKREPLLPITSP